MNPRSRRWLASAIALGVVIVVDGWLLYRFFARLAGQEDPIAPAPTVAYSHSRAMQTE